jgi:hypothetical protein
VQERRLHKRVDSARPAPRPAGDFATLNRPKSLPAILLTARPPLLYIVLLVFLFGFCFGFSLGSGFVSAGP